MVTIACGRCPTSPADNQVAEVHIPDATGKPTDVWTGPQVGWMMTRGLKNAYGRKVAGAWVLIPMCLLFVAGLLDWRRLRSLRTLDVIMLISFVVSLELLQPRARYSSRRPCSTRR